MPWLRSCLFVLLASLPVTAGDWPQWLGPTRDGHSPEKVAPWKGDLKVVWRQPVTDGHSSPVVAEGKVFLHTKVKGKAAEQLTAYDAATGKVQWQKDYQREKFFSVFGVGPQATPAVARGKVYAYGVTGVLSCYDTRAGELIWRVDTRKKFSPPRLFFGVACSPLLDDNKVFVNVGGKGSSVVAFNQANGKVAWQKLDATASYSSPILAGKGNQQQVIFLTQQGLASLSPKDGTVYWQYALVDKLDENSTTPVVVGDLLIAGSVKTGSVGLKLKEADGKPAVMKQWANPALTCYFSTPVAIGREHLYMVTGEPTLINPQATLHCVETATGKILWSRKGIGQYHGALLRTGDNKLLLLSDTGILTLLDPDPRGYRELARSKVCGKAWAHPALANGHLFLRDDKELLCLKLPVASP
jgi:outer membrane protein assembly factor BamB